VYRQLIDQVQGAIASGFLKAGDQIPTVRQVAVGLAINPNTVLRAYREMEIRGILDTQQGTGTFVAENGAKPDPSDRERVLDQLVGEFIARAGSGGFTLPQLIEALTGRLPEQSKSDGRKK
jgi:GntR family transcriptional regulator